MLDRVIAVWNAFDIDTRRRIIYALFALLLVSYYFRWTAATSPNHKRPKTEAKRTSVVVKKRTEESKESSSSDSDDDEDEDDVRGGVHRVKMVLVVRTDISMTKGKAAAQCCHACLAAYKSSDATMLKKWEQQGQPKVTLKCDSEDDMLTLEAMATSLNLVAESIIDAGRTQLEPGTRTVLAIGPARAEEIDKVTGHLKLY